MRELQLTRDPDNRRRLVLPGVGEFRSINRWGNRWLAQTPRHGAWTIAGKLMFRKVTTAQDTVGTVVATFHHTRDHHIEYAGRDLRLRAPGPGFFHGPPAASLLDGDRELVRFEPRPWRNRPITITILDEEIVERDPLLVLFAAHAAHLVASERAVAAGVAPAT